MTEITLFGGSHCNKTQLYKAALAERGLQYELAEVDTDPGAARRLTEPVALRNSPHFSSRGESYAIQPLQNWTRSWRVRTFMIPAFCMMSVQGGLFVPWFQPTPSFPITGKGIAWSSPISRSRRPCAAAE